MLTTGDGAWHLLGLVSYGSRRCGDGRAGVYTRVASYTQWVRDTVDTMDIGQGRGGTLLKSCLEYKISMNKYVQS